MELNYSVHYYYHAVKSYQSSVECGYKTLAEQVDDVSELAHMPLNVDNKQLRR